MAYSRAHIAEKERQAAGQASPSRSARDRLDDRFEQRAGTASIHSIHSLGRNGDSAAGARPSFGRRLLRGVTRFIVAAAIGVGATLAWQSYGDMAREMVATRAPMLGWLLSYVPTKPPAVAVSSNPAQQLPAGGLDALRRSVELLALRQEQMAQNIAALQAVEEDIRQKMSFTPSSVGTTLIQPPASLPQQKPAARALVPLGR